MIMICFNCGSNMTCTEYQEVDGVDECQSWECGQCGDEFDPRMIDDDDDFEEERDGGLLDSGHPGPEGGWYWDGYSWTIDF